MSSTTQNRIDGKAGPGDFEETLRLVARLSAPEGLEERVKAGLRAAPAPGRARVLAWPTVRRLGGVWMRSAAAAAIAAVVVGGSWEVYSHVQSNQPAKAVATQPRVSTQGGFSSAGAMRTPQTLNGPIVEPPAVAHPATTEPLPAEPEVKPAVKAPIDAVPIKPIKSAGASKAIAPPVAPLDK